MPSNARLYLLLVATTFALAGGLAHAGLQEGLDALRARDYARAAKELEPLANAGNPEAQYRIGRMQEFGAGYPKDVKQAIAWYRKAAAQGHVGAMEQLGEIYALGEGAPQDDAEAARWFRKAADAGNAAAQYNLGLAYAKGAGVKADIPSAIAWFRKSAAQGQAAALAKLGIAYSEGTGVAKDPVLAYANFALASRTNDPSFIAQRDAAAALLNPAQRKAADAAVDAWKLGEPGVTKVASASGGAGPAPKAAPERCSATGSMGGERFTLSHCAISLMLDAHSVAIWFNDDPITPQEVAEFQLSSYAGDRKGGKPRTRLIAMLCPGGGSAEASPSRVKAIDVNTNHAKSALAGIQNVFEAPKDFRVEKLAGKLEPGGRLAGRIVAAHGSTSFTLDFDLDLPQKDAAAGMSCK